MEEGLQAEGVRAPRRLGHEALDQRAGGLGLPQAQPGLGQQLGALEVAGVELEQEREVSRGAL
ncbi:MAG TPA: hypothetical protein DEA08_03490 [Planctomycetes bacterium]|nr:hypothetical protein [Planctomycetota bacterium]